MEDAECSKEIRTRLKKRQALMTLFEKSWVPAAKTKLKKALKAL